MTHPRRRSAFSLVELLVVVAIIGLLVGIIIATLGGASEQARTTVCVSRLKNLGAGLQAYLSEHDNRLPQVWLAGAPGSPNSPAEIVQPAAGASAMIGGLFAGTYGDLPFYGFDEIGPARRPLNPYLGVRDAPAEPVPPGDPEEHDDEKFQVPSVLDPSDTGLQDLEVEQLMGVEEARHAMERRYELLGSSYVLNDRILSDDVTPGAPEVSTLIPQEFSADGTLINDGRMPVIADPSRTILAGDGGIYNYDKRKDLQQHWHFGRESRASQGLDNAALKAYVETNILFTDNHVGSRIRVYKPDFSDPEVLKKMNTTQDYTFLPNPDWRLTPPTP